MSKTERIFSLGRFFVFTSSRRNATRGFLFVRLRFLLGVLVTSGGQTQIVVRLPLHEDWFLHLFLLARGVVLRHEAVRLALPAGINNKHHSAQTFWQTYVMSSCLCFTGALGTESESWSSSRLSKVLSELGDFLIVIPILAFFTPSGGLSFLEINQSVDKTKSGRLYFWLSSAVSRGLALGDLLVLVFSLDVMKASQREFRDFSWNFSESIIGPMLILGLIESFLGLFIM